MLPSLPTLLGIRTPLIETKTIGEVSALEPTLVFLHEGLGSVSLWRDFPAQLCDRIGIAGFLYSRNGYGQSPLFSRALSTDFMHVEAQESLPELLRAHQISHPILVGHSDGASISLIYSALAAGEDEWPEPIATVVIAPHIFVEPICTAAISELSERFKSDALMQTGLNRHHRDAQLTFKTWSQAWLSPEFEQWNIEGLLSSIQCDVLAIQGANDQYGTMAQIRGLAAHHKKTTVLEIAQCGHNPHAEATEQVLDEIARFIAPIITEY